MIVSITISFLFKFKIFQILKWATSSSSISSKSSVFVWRAGIGQFLFDWRFCSWVFHSTKLWEHFRIKFLQNFKARFWKHNLLEWFRVWRVCSTSNETHYLLSWVQIYGKIEFQWQVFLKNLFISERPEILLTAPSLRKKTWVFLRVLIASRNLRVPFE